MYDIKLPPKEENQEMGGGGGVGSRSQGVCYYGNELYFE